MAALAYPTVPRAWLQVGGYRFELVWVTHERDPAPDPGWHETGYSFGRLLEGDQVLAVESPDLERHLGEAGRLRQAALNALAEAEDAVGREPRAQAALTLFRDLLLVHEKAMGG